MGLMLSLLVGCVGVIEAIACYQTIRYGILPQEKSSLDGLRRNYDAMFTESLSQASARSDSWKLGPQGYLDIKGGGKDGPIKASIKFLGADTDSTPVLFSTKISSFGQDSLENEVENRNEWNTVKTQIPQNNNSYYINNNNTSPRVSPAASRDDVSNNFWDEEEKESEPEPKEKIKWHYRPITPTDESSLPEIHFDSYERNNSTNSDEFLRSPDGIKFRPLQRDDGTGRRRSFKKRHSSSSTSSRESKLSREEELKMFTSLEESEMESCKFNSAPSLSIDSVRKSKSRSPSRNFTPENSITETPEATQTDRPHLKDIPKSESFEDLSELTADDNAEYAEPDQGQSVGTKEVEDNGSTVIFRTTGVNW